MLLSLLILPLIGIFLVFDPISAEVTSRYSSKYNDNYKIINSKNVTLIITGINLLLSLVIFGLFNNSASEFQFVQEHYHIGNFDIYLGIDGLSIYFVLLTTAIMPIALISSWNSIYENKKSFLIILLLLETLLLAVFLVLDILLFYIFFESILIPLFILIGLFGSSHKVRAGFYLFLYTLLGSLFLLLAILTISSIMGTTDYEALFKTNHSYFLQMYLFTGIFIAFSIKTPVYFLHTWLLKAHVESPLAGSIILAGIVLKLSLYGIYRFVLPLLPQAYLNYSYIIFIICVITIIYASLSTLRVTDIKELIAYSSVSHASVYLLGALSNTIQGIEGSIILGLAHGLVSSALFICVGGIMYERTNTRFIFFYKGLAQAMPIFSILLFVLVLANSGAPLTLNFIGEFMSLYGAFERFPVLGLLASTSIVLSAAYNIYMFNRIVFSGSFTVYFENIMLDINKREFLLLFVLVLLTVILGIQPGIILDGLHTSVTSLIFNTSE